MESGCDLVWMGLVWMCGLSMRVDRIWGGDLVWMWISVGCGAVNLVCVYLLCGCGKV